MTRNHRRVACVLLLLWLLAAIAMLFLGKPHPHYYDSYEQYLLANIDLIPFQSTQNYIELLRLDKIEPDAVARNIAGNIVLFVPLGFLLPCLYKRFVNAKPIIISSVLLAFVFETIQLLTMCGCFDIDDIILRSTGTMIGLMLWKISFIYSKSSASSNDSKTHITA